jgi:hypothetical protein
MQVRASWCGADERGRRWVHIRKRETPNQCQIPETKASVEIAKRDQRRAIVYSVRRKRKGEGAEEKRREKTTGGKSQKIQRNPGQHARGKELLVRRRAVEIDDERNPQILL